jgi:hypothetical protein
LHLLVIVTAGICKPSGVSRSFDDSGRRLLACHKRGLVGTLKVTEKLNPSSRRSPRWSAPQAPRYYLILPVYTSFAWKQRSSPFSRSWRPLHQRRCVPFASAVPSTSTRATYGAWLICSFSGLGSTAGTACAALFLPEPGMYAPDLHRTLARRSGGSLCSVYYAFDGSLHADRLLRLVRAQQESQVPTPRVLGVDDFSNRAQDLLRHHPHRSGKSGCQ